MNPPPPPTPPDGFEVVAAVKIQQMPMHGFNALLKGLIAAYGKKAKLLPTEAGIWTFICAPTKPEPTPRDATAEKTDP